MFSNNQFCCCVYGTCFVLFLGALGVEIKCRSVAEHIIGRPVNKAQKCCYWESLATIASVLQEQGRNGTASHVNKTERERERKPDQLLVYPVAEHTLSRTFGIDMHSSYYSFIVYLQLDGTSEVGFVEKQNVGQMLFSSKLSWL